MNIDHAKLAGEDPRVMILKKYYQMKTVRFEKKLAFARRFGALEWHA